MTNHVVYKDHEGRNMDVICLTRKSKDNLVAMLNKRNIQYVVLEKEDVKLHVVYVYFKIEDIADKTKQPYAFVDIYQVAKKSDIITVQLTDKTLKDVFVDRVEYKTIKEIQDIAKSCNRKKLCRVVKLVKAS